MQIDEIIKSGECYVLCICEGRAEEDIVNFLLDHDLLIFSREDLIEKRPIRLRSVSKIQKKYLSFDHSKHVMIVRILDSKNEIFKLSKAYKERYEGNVINIVTAPEIEILIIIHRGDYSVYTTKYKSKEKPSIYCAREYKIKNIKNAGVMESIFKSSEELLDTLKQYQTYKSNNSYSIYDLLRSN